MPEYKGPTRPGGESLRNAPTREPFALAFSIVLLFRIAGAMFLVGKYGGSLALTFPASTGLNDATRNFTGALVLFLIGATDIPTLWRRSRFVRSQIQCWALWEALLGILWLTESRLGIGHISLIVFCLLSVLLAICSVAMLYRPRDLLNVNMRR
jgi:hypothetical protein